MIVFHCSNQEQFASVRGEFVLNLMALEGTELQAIWGGGRCRQGLSNGAGMIGNGEGLEAWWSMEGHVVGFDCSGRRR